MRERYEKEMKKVLPGVADMVNLEFEQAELARATDVLNRIEQRVVELRTETEAPARVALYDAALPPQAPVEAVPYERMGLAGLVGFCLPFVLVVGWERIVRRIGDAGQLEKETNLAVIGEIARLPERTRKPRAATSKRTAQKLRLYEESIDSMRTFLVLAEDLKYAKVFAVTSATGHEGKTSVAAQLALSLARASGKPTLLIDGDMREPDLHDVFEVARTPGLAEVLAGDCELESAIVPSWTPHVFLLPAGELKTSPHQLVGNGALRSVLERTSEKYGYIVLDTPPILSAAESLVLAKAADASLDLRDAGRQPSGTGEKRLSEARGVGLSSGCRRTQRSLSTKLRISLWPLRARDELMADRKKRSLGDHDLMSRSEQTQRADVRQTRNHRPRGETDSQRPTPLDHVGGRIAGGHRIVFLASVPGLSYHQRLCWSVRTHWRRKASSDPPSTTAVVTSSSTLKTTTHLFTWPKPWTTASERSADTKREAISIYLGALGLEGV